MENASSFVADSGRGRVIRGRRALILGYIPRMSLFGGHQKDPEWLGPVREFCRSANIEIVGWGLEAIVVRAATRDEAIRIATELASFDLRVREDDGDEYAGLLTLTHRPAGH
jgi:hypothetical protein